MMKRLYNYLGISILMILFASCGTDLEPEVFPNRTMTEGHSTSFDCNNIEILFASDSKIYFYSSDLGAMIAYDMSTRTTSNIEIQVTVSESDIPEEEWQRRLMDCLTNMKNLMPGGGFWYNGKGYIVTWESVFVFSPDTSVWTCDEVDAGQYNDGGQMSNAVFTNNQLVQLSSSYIYRYSVESMEWERKDITHYFNDLSVGRPVLLAGENGQLYAYDYYENSLYAYDGASNLWKEIALNPNVNKSGTVDYVLSNGNLLYFCSSFYSSGSYSVLNIWEIDLNKTTDNATIINIPSEYYSQVSYSELVFNIGNTCYNWSYDNSGLRVLYEFKLK